MRLSLSLFCYIQTFGYKWNQDHKASCAPAQLQQHNCNSTAETRNASPRCAGTHPHTHICTHTHTHIHIDIEHCCRHTRYLALLHTPSLSHTHTHTYLHTHMTFLANSTAAQSRVTNTQTKHQEAQHAAVHVDGHSRSLVYVPTLPTATTRQSARQIRGQDESLE